MRSYGVIAVGFVMALATVACSSESSPTAAPQPTDTTTTSEPPAGGEAGQLSIVDFSFDPAAVTAGPGGALAVTNDGGTTHTFTMDDGSIDQELAPGESVDVVVGTEGGFHCEIHASMTGEVTVP